GCPHSAITAPATAVLTVEITGLDSRRYGVLHCSLRCAGVLGDSLNTDSHRAAVSVGIGREVVKDQQRRAGHLRVHSDALVPEMPHGLRPTIGGHRVANGKSPTRDLDSTATPAWPLLSSRDPAPAGFSRS